eukprot:9858163-Karenia_brevis.AAC.1
MLTPKGVERLWYQRGMSQTKWHSYIGTVLKALLTNFRKLQRSNDSPCKSNHVSISSLCLVHRLQIFSR